MITITRRQAGDLCGMIRRLPCFATPSTGPPLRCEAGPDGLSVRCRTVTAALEFRQPGVFARAQVSLPWVMLQQIAGRRAEPVTLEQIDHRVIARWHNGRVPQEMRYDLSHDTHADVPDANVPDAVTAAAVPADLPPLPNSMAENSPRLLTALRDAANTTDQQKNNQQTPPAAVNCLQLRGGIGALAATDRTQLLVQRGFEFPWSGERLIRSSTLFDCRALAGGDELGLNAPGINKSHQPVGHRLSCNATRHLFPFSFGSQYSRRCHPQEKHLDSKLQSFVIPTNSPRPRPPGARHDLE